MLPSGVGLTGDYFSGLVRQRWLAVQGGIAAFRGQNVIVDVAVAHMAESIHPHAREPRLQGSRRLLEKARDPG